MLSEKDTIVACSSPPGRGAISVIRLSGDKAFSIIQKITKNKLKKQISVVKFPLNADLIEKCVLTIFKAPNSYTCLLYTSPSPRDLSTSRMPSSA